MHNQIKADIDLMLKSHLEDDTFTTEYSSDNEGGNFIKIPLLFLSFKFTKEELTIEVLKHFKTTLPEGFFIRINSFDINDKTIAVGNAYSYNRKG